MPPALVCEIESAIADQRTPHARSAAIASIIDAIHESLTWVHAGERGNPEVTSYFQILWAAQAHETRMLARPTVPEGEQL